MSIKQKAIVAVLLLTLFSYIGFVLGFVIGKRQRPIQPHWTAAQSLEQVKRLHHRMTNDGYQVVFVLDAHWPSTNQPNISFMATPRWTNAIIVGDSKLVK